MSDRCDIEIEKVNIILENNNRRGVLEKLIRDLINEVIIN